MSKKEFPIEGHCLSTNIIIVNYLKDNRKGYTNNVHSRKAIGVAWNKDRWWYVLNKSSTPKYSPLDIMAIITEINGMNNFSIVTGTETLSTSSGIMSTSSGTLSTSSGIMSGNPICTTTTTTTPIYDPNSSLTNPMWIYRGAGISTGTIVANNLVTEPIKLRIKCRNLKKNLKVSLLQINLK